MFISQKKSLGQHFLTDENIAKKIVSSLQSTNPNVLEIGAGTGALTKHLFSENLKIIEIDKNAVVYLKNTFPKIKDNIIAADFLQFDLSEIFENTFCIIGNFPYNISSQIFFKTLDYRNKIEEVVCMIQKEVAERIASPPGSKRYGILSVLLQAFFDIEYLFTVNENVFNPPPKVKSAVIRLKRNQSNVLDCDEKLFFRIIKAAFNQRRKMLSNSLKAFYQEEKKDLPPVFLKRPEQLGVKEFIELTNFLA